MGASNGARQGGRQGARQGGSKQSKTRHRSVHVSLFPGYLPFFAVLDYCVADWPSLPNHYALAAEADVGCLVCRESCFVWASWDAAHPEPASFLIVMCT